MAAPAIAGRGQTRSILLLEDEPVLRASIARGLGKMSGVDVMSAATFAEALKLIDARAPALVVSDIDLPDRSGLEMVGELGRRGIRAPIIFVTAYLKTYRSRIPQRPDILVLEKPVPLDQLRARVAEWIGLVSDRPRVPFSVADYVQLACMGHHSVLVEVEQRGVAVGRVMVVRGELWSATDAIGTGEAAFKRLAFLADEGVRCVALAGPEGAREIEARFDALVLDAARLHDEEVRDRASRSGPSTEPALPPPMPPLRSEPDRWDEQEDTSPSLPQAMRTRVAPTRSFEELWEDGVDALLSRDYARAARAFQEAERLRPDDRRVIANLARLRQLGHPVEGDQPGDGESAPRGQRR